MALTPAATVSTTREVKLEPKVRQKLKTKLTEYANIVTQIKALEHAKKKLSDELGALRDDTGETTLSLDGYGTITLVAGTRQKFNPKTFVANGGDLEIYNQSFDTVPVKAFNKITLPGAKDDE